MNDAHRPFVRAIAIFLVALAAAGCATQQVAPTPRNVIVMYADGVAATQLEFGRYSSQALRNQSYATTDTVLTQGTIGLLTTHPYEAFATDSAATASAMSTGVKTTIGAIGVGPDGKPVRTAAQAAKVKATADVTEKSVTEEEARLKEQMKKLDDLRKAVEAARKAAEAEAARLKAVQEEAEAARKAAEAEAARLKAAQEEAEKARKEREKLESENSPPPPPPENPAAPENPRPKT